MKYIRFNFINYRINQIYFDIKLYFKIKLNKLIINQIFWGIGDWGLGIGDCIYNFLINIKNLKFNEFKLFNNI